jgi:hypothetical protein
VVGLLIGVFGYAWLKMDKVVEVKCSVFGPEINFIFSCLVPDTGQPNTL